MDSSLARKIEEAKEYAAQDERGTLANCQAMFGGDNSDHEISYESG